MVIYLGSFVQLCCGEGGTLQTNITGMCGECLQCLGHTGFASAHSMCAFLIYCAQTPGCSAWVLSKGGPGLCALLRSKPLRFKFSDSPQRHRLGWACVLCPSQVRAAQVIRCLASTLSPSGQCVLSPLWSQPLSFLGVLCVAVSGMPCVSCGELISDCDHPGECQLFRIPGRLG